MYKNIHYFTPPTYGCSCLAMKFWIFGIGFLIPSLLEMAIALIDTFDWITLIEPSCNFTSEPPVSSHPTEVQETLSDILNWISVATLSWSFITTTIFVLVFVVGCCLHIQSKTMLKLLLEISIFVSLFGPVSNSGYLLRDCLTGYLIIVLSLTFYSIAVIVTVVATEIQFRSIEWYQVTVFVFLTVCKAVQIFATISTLAMFLLIPGSLPVLKYSYLLLVAIQFTSMWITNLISRWKFYHLFFKKTFTLHCIGYYSMPRALCCVRVTDIVVSLLNIFSCGMLLVLTGMYFNVDTLFYMAVVSLSTSCLIGFLQLPWKHCCVNNDALDNERTHLIGYD